MRFLWTHSQVIHSKCQISHCCETYLQTYLQIYKRILCRNGLRGTPRHIVCCSISSYTFFMLNVIRTELLENTARNFPQKGIYFYDNGLDQPAVFVSYVELLQKATVSLKDFRCAYSISFSYDLKIFWHVHFLGKCALACSTWDYASRESSRPIFRQQLQKHNVGMECHNCWRCSSNHAASGKLIHEA